MIIQRDLLEEIKPFLKRQEFIAIVGPRQSGKTTFLKLIKDYLCADLKINESLIRTLTFEDRKLLTEFEADAVSFVRSYFPPRRNKTVYLMIDEFQYAENGGQKLKLIYDTLKGIKIIITGSSSLDIKAQVGRYLVGRILTFFLPPFNFGEFLRAKDTRLERIYQERSKKIVKWLIKQKQSKQKKGVDFFAPEIIKYYEEFCIWGGYPAVVLSKSKKECQKVLNDIYSNYILKDIKGLLELATDRNLSNLSQYLATQIANILVYQNLQQISNLDYRQIKRHLNILKETFVVCELNPFFRNRQKELSKNPKVFFTDLGFRNSLIENMNVLNKRSDSGAMIENAVFIRLNEIFREKGQINFWRTKVGAEVDFVLQNNEKIIPIEVKFSRFDKEKISKSFRSFIKDFNTKYAIVLTRDYWGKTNKNGVEILFAPVYYL